MISPLFLGCFAFNCPKTAVGQFGHVHTEGWYTHGYHIDPRLIGHDTHFIAPLAVIDITAKAQADPNAVVEPDDLIAYERGHGRIPRGACVAMNSGWDAMYT